VRQVGKVPLAPAHVAAALVVPQLRLPLSKGGAIGARLWVVCAAASEPWSEPSTELCLPLPTELCHGKRWLEQERDPQAPLPLCRRPQRNRGFFVDLRRYCFSMCAQVLGFRSFVVSICCSFVDLGLQLRTGCTAA
jgi:hypothetical protein